jgi:hypothetical protein
LILENLLNESNAKEKDLEILRKRVMIETNELNSNNAKIERKVKESEKLEKDVSVHIYLYMSFTG